MADSDATPDAFSTLPDPIDQGARAQLDLLDGERIVRCWRTGFGFLVMTNLRCLHVWHKPQVFSRSSWRAGPSFYFYNLAAPQVVAKRFVELSEDYVGSFEGGRFLVRHPEEVCREIDAARAAGRAEWEVRRARAGRELHRLRAPALPAGTTVIVREVVKVRCNFCGNLMDVARSICPACGAPQK